jgi:hypothetical protein
MVRIAITVEAFEVIARTMPLGSFGFERDPNTKGERTVWLEDAMADRPSAMRGSAKATATPFCGSRGGMTEKSPEHELHRQRSEEPTL